MVWAYKHVISDLVFDTNYRVVAGPNSGRSQTTKNAKVPYPMDEQRMRMTKTCPRILQNCVLKLWSVVHNIQNSVLILRIVIRNDPRYKQRGITMLEPIDEFHENERV